MSKEVSLFPLALLLPALRGVDVLIHPLTIIDIMEGRI